MGARGWGTGWSACFRGDGNVLELDTVLSVQPCECTECYGTAYFKMAKITDLTLCEFYRNLLKEKKIKRETRHPICFCFSRFSREWTRWHDMRPKPQTSPQTRLNFAGADLSFESQGLNVGHEHAPCPGTAGHTGPCHAFAFPAWPLKTLSMQATLWKGNTRIRRSLFK